MIVRYLLLCCTLFFNVHTIATTTLADVQKLRESLKNTPNSSAVINAFEELIAADPHNALVHFEYGSYLADLDNRSYDSKAIEHMIRATQIDANINWLFTLGCFCCRVGRMKESVTCYQEILKKYPTQSSVLYNLGYTLKTMGNNDAAIALYRKVLAINPDYEPAHLGLSFALINSGQFKEGWKEHLWNLKFQKKNADSFQELLKNNALAGKKILLLPEGGLGDTINFIRYAQRLKTMGVFVIAAVQPSLLPLLSRCQYIDYLMSINQYVPVHDASVTLMSLAPIFGDAEEEIPRNIPYIFADPARIAYWHEQLKSDPHFKIGICWQPDVHNDVSRLPIARRGIPLSRFYKLGSTPGITLYSLQKKEGLDQLASLPSNVRLHVFDDSFDNISFSDTAAVMHELDLIISADTATAHLAGAMGKPVWLVLPYATDWRWLNNRFDSPWYPTMRVFKQPEPYDWESVMNEVHTLFFNSIYKSQKKDSV